MKRRSYEGYLKHASGDAARAAARKAKGRGKGKDKGKDKEHGATASSSSSGAVARHHPRDATPPLTFIERKEAARRRLLEDD